MQDLLPDLKSEFGSSDWRAVDLTIQCLMALPTGSAYSDCGYGLHLLIFAPPEDEFKETTGFYIASLELRPSSFSPSSISSTLRAHDMDTPSRRHNSHHHSLNQSIQSTPSELIKSGRAYQFPRLFRTNRVHLHDFVNWLLESEGSVSVASEPRDSRLNVYDSTNEASRVELTSIASIRLLLPHPMVSKAYPCLLTAIYSQQNSRVLLVED
ncbi:unnamed protein product [Protopolystoma xenopodis]|uniref:Uncharacterized protein n=1 Tax=Protopolystoma xenopodis TaxID=117903 RepID=A0A3S5BG57_9PLAT|nr:unnamed protein product [Protopolystoma xenopodis]